MNKVRATELMLVFAFAHTTLPGSPPATDLTLLSLLIEQGMPPESILGIDKHGVPEVCGVGWHSERPFAADDGSLNTSSASVLPPGIRSWECVPNVIRNDGVDFFRLEVDVNGPIRSVKWAWHEGTAAIAESGTNISFLRDDGLEGDRVAGDSIFTSERFIFDTNWVLLPHQRLSTNTPAGIYIEGAGEVIVEEVSSPDNWFLIHPSFAVLNTNVPPVETVMLATNIQASAHLINIQSTNREVQRALRFGEYLDPITWQIYAVLPDEFDFLTFFSTDHIEYIGETTSANFTLGRFDPVTLNVTGIGLNTYDFSSYYGSGGRLQGIPILDIMERGIDTSQNATHEITHQWSAFVSPSLYITTGTSHYSRDCNANSLLGGLYLFNTNGTGGFTRGCTFPDYFEAIPLDKYMMGLISTSAVPPLQVSSNILAIPCGNQITNLRAPVTISDIVAIHGIRTPGPATSQKDFRIGFATGSHNRLLTPTEMTFYDLMAAHYTKSLPASQPPPNLEVGWVPITKFFGEGTTWTSEVLGLIRPTITNIQWQASGFQVEGTGYPGYSYRLHASTNLAIWTPITNTIADPGGSFSLLDTSQPRPSTRWYRISAP